MSKVYENKANHNKDFLDAIISDYPTEYFDWKVTVQFYIALHRCYCVIEASGQKICNRHNDNINNLSAIDLGLSKNLFKLYKYSRQSRYDGFMSDEAMNRINKINFSKNEILLASINKGIVNYYPVSV